MSDMIEPKRAGIWPEALRLFRLHQREWTKWAVCFFIVTMPIDIWFSHGMEQSSENLMALIHSGFKNPPANPPSPHFMPTFFMMLIGFVQFYIYSVLFLKQEADLGFPKITVGGFFYYMGTIILWWLLVMGIVLLFTLLLVLLLIIVMVIVTIAFGKTADNTATLLPILMFPLMIGLMCYVLARYTLVFPLAACRIKSPIKTGVKVIRGHIWRVFLNLLPLWLAVALMTPLNMWLMPKISVLLALGVPGSENALVGIVSLLVIIVLQTIIGAASAVFNCAACTILVKEKQAVDPTFKLIASV